MTSATLNSSPGFAIPPIRALTASGSAATDLIGMNSAWFGNDWSASCNCSLVKSMATLEVWWLLQLLPSKQSMGTTKVEASVLHVIFRV
jgi:hypothetical protein